jgi:putative transposase
MARQASAERAWSSISRFYDNCKKGISLKKGYPKFQKDCRSVEYKTSGWVRFVLSKWILSKDERQFRKVDYKTNGIDNLIIM